MKLILASMSATRQRLLAAAGVPFAAESPGVDEEELKGAARSAGVQARAVADLIAEAKARKVSSRHDGDLVLGCDQVLALDDGSILGKARDMAELEWQLKRLRGSSHRLIAAAVMAEHGEPVWRHVDSARLHVRNFSDEFLAEYLHAEGDLLLSMVGGYRLEGMGAQLFSRIDGDYFTVLGLTLLPSLDYLRVRGVIGS